MLSVCALDIEEKRAAEEDGQGRENSGALADRRETAHFFLTLTGC